MGFYVAWQCRSGLPADRTLVPERAARRRARSGMLVTAVLLGLAGCAPASGSAPGAPATPVPAASARAVQGPQALGDPPTGTVAPPLPNPVTTVRKVARAGQPNKPVVTATAAPFGSPAVYPDGVQLRIVKATKALEKGHGPGVMGGRGYVRFELELRNGTAAAINLNQVVLTTYYGATKQLAAPVYTEGTATRDFGGTVAPGASTTASYAFAVPGGSLSNVTMVVDFDGMHSSAVYRGAVKTS